MIIILPLLYCVLGMTYGTWAIINRWRFHLHFARLSEEEKNQWEAAPEAQRLGGVQWTSFVFTALMLLSILMTALAFLDIEDFMNYGLIGLILLPFFVIGFNVPSVWNHQKVFLEEAGLRAKSPQVVAYYAILVPTWLVGVVGSFVAVSYALFAWF